MIPLLPSYNIIFILPNISVFFKGQDLSRWSCVVSHTLCVVKRAPTLPLFFDILALPSSNPLTPSIYFTITARNHAKPHKTSKYRAIVF